MVATALAANNSGKAPAQNQLLMWGRWDVESARKREQQSDEERAKQWPNEKTPQPMQRTMPRPTALMVSAQPHAFDAPVVHVEAGDGYFLVLLQSGHVFAQGVSSRGCLGLGPRKEDCVVAAPRRVKFGFGEAGESVKIVQLCKGWDHVLALDSRGDVWSWGENAQGQLGICEPSGTTATAGTNGLNTSSSTTAAATTNGTLLVPENVYANPIRVESLGSSSTKDSGSGRIVQVCALRDASLALSERGQVWTWGSGGRACSLGMVGGESSGSEEGEEKSAAAERSVRSMSSASEDVAKAGRAVIPLPVLSFELNKSKREDGSFCSCFVTRLQACGDLVLAHTTTDAELRDELLISAFPGVETEASLSAKAAAAAKAEKEIQEKSNFLGNPNPGGKPAAVNIVQQQGNNNFVRGGSGMSLVASGGTISSTAEEEETSLLNAPGGMEKIAAAQRDLQASVDRMRCALDDCRDWQREMSGICPASQLAVESGGTNSVDETATDDELGKCE